MTEYAQFDMRNSNSQFCNCINELVSLIIFSLYAVCTAINTGTLVNYFNYFLEINVSSYILCTF